MGTIQIQEGIYSVGVLNPNMRVFDIIMRTDYGTSYNAYLVKGSEKTALIETVHDRFFEEYIDNIAQVCDPKTIDYVVMNHNEPDHSGALHRLYEVNPNITVVTSQAGTIYIKSIANKPDLKVQTVKDGDSIDLGGKTLSFVSAPFLHWPDSMFTYCPQDKLVFSCDFLGAHYCEPRMFDTFISYPNAYEEAFEGYYNAIMGPFPTYVQAGLQKLEALDADTVCTSHGPILTRGGRLEKNIEAYRKWSTPAERTNKKIPIFYVSAYGSTTNVAEAIKEGILSVVKDADITLYNIIEHDMAKLAHELNTSDAFLIGSPTINRDAVHPAWILATSIDAINAKDKPCAVFGSFGWSGEAVPMLCDRLKSLKLKVFGEGYRVKFVPSAEELAAAKEFGAQFAQSL